MIYEDSGKQIKNYQFVVGLIMLWTMQVCSLSSIGNTIIYLSSRPSLSLPRSTDTDS